MIEWGAVATIATPLLVIGGGILRGASQLGRLQQRVETLERQGMAAVSQLRNVNAHVVDVKEKTELNGQNAQ